jgi:hypothetical protein
MPKPIKQTKQEPEIIDFDDYTTKPEDNIVGKTSKTFTKIRPTTTEKMTEAKNASQQPIELLSEGVLSIRTMILTGLKENDKRIKLLDAKIDSLGITIAKLTTRQTEIVKQLGEIMDFIEKSQEEKPIVGTLSFPKTPESKVFGDNRTGLTIPAINNLALTMIQGMAENMKKPIKQEEKPILHKDITFCTDDLPASNQTLKPPFTPVETPQEAIRTPKKDPECRVITGQQIPPPTPKKEIPPKKYYKTPLFAIKSKFNPPMLPCPHPKTFTKSAKRNNNIYKLTVCEMCREIINEERLEI